MVKFINGLLPRRIQNNKGFLGALLAGAGAALNIAGAATRDDKVENQWLANPEYPEAEQSREKWWETLQQWGDDPNYGAISPDWNNIWETVQRQVKEYYSGGPLTTGMRDKLKANLARRNMGDQPASDDLLMRSYADESNRMKDVATSQGLNKAELSENARRLWLSSLTDLSKQKPAGQWNSIVKSDKTSDILNAAGEGIGGVGSAMVNYQGWQDLLKTIDNKNETARTEDTPQAIRSPYDNDNWMDFFMKDRGF